MENWVAWRVLPIPGVHTGAQCVQAVSSELYRAV